MDFYVVVTRQKKIPMSRPFTTVRDAGDYIYQRRSFAREVVLKQPGDGKGRPRGPMIELGREEKRQLEACLYPALFEA